MKVGDLVRPDWDSECSHTGVVLNGPYAVQDCEDLEDKVEVVMVGWMGGSGIYEEEYACEFLRVVSSANN